MSASIKLNCSEWFLRSKYFFCCIPVRVGVIIMTVLGMLLSGALTVALWYEVSGAKSQYLSESQNTIFILAGIVQTILFIVSVLGFIGAIVRKQLFIHIYAWAIYIHFLINIGVAIYLFYMVATLSRRARWNICMAAIQSPDAEEQCNSLVEVATSVIVGIQLAVLALELEGAIIVTRYLNLLKGQKYRARQSRLTATTATTPRSAGFNLQPTQNGRYSSIPVQDSEHEGLVSHTPGTSIHKPYSSENEEDPFNPYDGLPVAEQGYAGGSWTHRDISIEEKSRYSGDSDTDTIRAVPMDDDRSMKSPVTPVNARVPSVSDHGSILPNYSLQDPRSHTGDEPLR